MSTPRGAWSCGSHWIRAAVRIASFVFGVIGWGHLPVLAQCDDGAETVYCTDECQCGDMCCEQCTPWWAHQTGIWGEFLYLQPSGADMDHAQQQNGTGGAGTVPFGSIGTADPGYEPGFRVGGSIATSACSSIVIGYSFFESQEVNSLAAPVIPGGGGAVGSLVQHPGAAITASAGPVNAAYDIDFQLADFAYRALWRGNNRQWVNYRIGGRYAHLDQEFLQSGQFSGSQAGVINTGTNVRFDGGGLLAGLDGERRLGCGGLSVYGLAAASPLSGQFRTSYRMHNQTTDADLALVQWKSDRIVTILDLEAGVAWTGPCKNLRFSAGYMSQHWYNAVTTPVYVDAVQANNYTDVGDTLSFDGLVTRVEYRF